MSSVDSPTTHRARRRLIAAAAVVALSWAVALALVRESVPGPLGSVDATAKLWQARALAEGRLEIDYPARDFDPDARFIPDWYVLRVDGRVRSVYVNPFTMLLALVMKLAGAAAAQIVPLAAGAVTVVLTMLLVRRHRLVRDDDLWMACLVAGLATPILYYALSPLEHVLSTVFATGALLVASDAAVDAYLGKPARPWRWAQAGALLALAALSRGECFLLAAAAGVVVTVTLLPAGVRRAAVALGAMAAGGVATLIAWFLAVPQAWATQRALVAQGGRTPRAMLERFYVLLAGVHPGERVAGIVGERAADLAGGVAGACMLAGVALAVISGTKRSALRHAATALLALAMLASLASWRLEGLFVVCPCVALVAFLARGDAGLNRPVSAIVLGTTTLYVALAGLLLPNAGASQFGPRYLLPVVPAAATVAFLLARSRAKSEKSRWLAFMLAAALVVAFVSTGKGALLLRRAAEVSRETERALEAMPKPLVVFSPELSQEFYVYRAGAVFLASPVLQVRSDADVSGVVAILRARGVREFTVVTSSDRADARLELFRRAGAQVPLHRVGVPLPVRGRAVTVAIEPADVGGGTP